MVRGVGRRPSRPEQLWTDSGSGRPHGGEASVVKARRSRSDFDETPMITVGAVKEKDDMRFRIFVGMAVLGVASLVAAQTETQTTTQTETKWLTVDGEVVRYEPGKVIVIRGTDKRDVVYTLAPSVAVPAEVQVGRRVTLYTEPTAGGSTQLVRRVATTSITAEGQTKNTTVETRTLPSGITTRTTTTTTSGKIEAYEPGKTLTILAANGNKVTYLITGKSKVPADLVVGTTVTILPLGGSNEQTAETVTVVKTEALPQP